jgi:hypothetical protein
MPAVATAVELVQFESESYRTAQWFRALEKAAPDCGIDLHRTTTYRGDAPWMLLWGPGAPERRAVMEAHIRNGGRAIVMDLAYWDRHNKARISIDAPHPQAWVMRRNMPGDRVKKDQIVVKDAWKSTGSIVIAGLGEKARVQYGESTVDKWEASMMHACRARWPDRRILYRRKKPQYGVPGWADLAPGCPIDQLMIKRSLVITWHSNVAVDAIRMGIPVVCRDGAAAAVCPSEIPDEPKPLSPEIRAQFLANLAYFQWSMSEAAPMWRHLLEMLA